MPTIGRDQINAGETIDPVFDATEEAATAEGGTADAAETTNGYEEQDVANPADDDTTREETTNGYEEQDVANPADDGLATAEPPRMDDLVEDAQQLRGLENRTNALTDNDVDLPDAARQHMAAPGGGRADNRDEAPFEAPRSWGGAGLEHAGGPAPDAERNDAARDEAGDEARDDREPGGGVAGRATNGTSHPSEEHRQNEEAELGLDPVLGRPFEEPEDSDSGSGHGGGRSGEHRGGGRGGEAADESSDSSFDEGPSAG